MSFIAACIQMNSGEDVAANIAQAEKLLREALAEKAQFIALPENCFSMRREGMAGGGMYPLEGRPGICWAEDAAAPQRVHLRVGSLRAEVPGRGVRLYR
ncbi:MAG: nitrilase-related carbon-nitrogen hydrolase, partial [Alphaproteobacteria bacterium]